MYKKIKDFIQANGMGDKIHEVFCYSDPARFGIVVFQSVAAARLFLRHLRKAVGGEIDSERTLRFAPNRTLSQRGHDKRLGQIKHLLHLEGHALETIKILWRKNIVKLEGKVV